MTTPIEDTLCRAMGSPGALSPRVEDNPHASPSPTRTIRNAQGTSIPLVMEAISEGSTPLNEDGETDAITSTVSQQQDLGMGLPSGNNQVSLILILLSRVVFRWLHFPTGHLRFSAIARGFPILFQRFNACFNTGDVLTDYP